jgi:ABC-type phosphate transport system substrate-binding protein
VWKTPLLRLASGAAVAWLLACLPAAAAPSYVLVVNRANPATSLGRREASAIFLRRTSEWDDGRPMLPVDGPDSPARESFSKDVHGKKAAAIRSHWLQVIFSGRGVPPPQKASDADVIAYVTANAGAIGYVSPQAITPDVKAIRLLPE